MQQLQYYNYLQYYNAASTPQLRTINDGMMVLQVSLQPGPLN